MSWNIKYPYTDFHELNLDWLLEEMKRLQEEMQGLLEEAVAQATANAKAYVDSKLAGIEADFATLQSNFNALSIQVSDLSGTVATFTTNFTAQLNALKAYVDDQIEVDRLQMTLLIQQNNEYLLREMESYLAQIKVINYFTGEKVTIQDMFNYLAGLHLSDAIDYDTMATRAKTYTEFVNMNMTYTNLAMHGNTLYV